MIYSVWWVRVFSVALFGVRFGASAGVTSAYLREILLGELGKVINIAERKERTFLSNFQFQIPISARSILTFLFYLFKKLNFRLNSVLHNGNSITADLSQNIIQSSAPFLEVDVTVMQSLLCGCCG